MAAIVSVPPPDVQENSKNDDKTLLIRSLPSRLSEEECIDFLKHFGAISVRYMGTKGPMKYCAFARYDNSEKTGQALSKLHQLRFLGRRLRVEYALSRHEKHFPTDLPPLPKVKLGKKAARINENQSKVKSRINYFSDTWDIPFIPNPNISYQYPPPTLSTLKNISNCLAAVPKFYVQVLHLMNRMNLPPPFGEVTPTPPIPGGTIIEEMELSSSSEESELESDSEPVTHHITNAASNKRPPRKTHTAIIKKQLKQQKMLAVQKQQQEQREDALQHRQREEQQEQQEQALPAFQQHIALRLPAELFTNTGNALEESNQGSGFGQIQPIRADTSTSDVIAPAVPLVKEDQNLNNKMEGTPFITAKELASARMTDEELATNPVFKSYSAGEATPRLYIKNLSKQVTEDELKYIFGRYVDWNNPEEVSLFNIRHMREGRMKGQAFVTLPHIEAARAAVTECHAYKLHDKPMSVSYAKSS